MCLPRYMGVELEIEKKKLLKKQQKGKARSKQFGRVEIPQEAFIGVLKINKET
jgi:GTP-binding protein LepA